MRALRYLVLAALTAGGYPWAPPSGAAEPARRAMPVKAPPAQPADDWTGLYVGGHLGYAAGRSDWTATGATPVAGTLDFFAPFDPFTGTGSYFAGLQAGYNYMLPSRLLLGIEGDVSFPNTIAGSRTFATPALGVASYRESVEAFGTLRARIGREVSSPVFGHWLVYATGGFAWSYDRFTRTQLLGVPLGGFAGPDTVETTPKMRTGFAAGAGIEVPVAPQWTARLEYLFLGFGTQGALFPAGAQRFAGDLDLHNVRLGLNYRYDAKAGAFALPSAPENDIWAFHAQTTYFNQYAAPFHAPYRGDNSLTPNHGRETWDFTLYAGLRLWSGAEFWVNPEISQGFGLDNTHGTAGYVSGEAYKVGASVPYTRVPRYFIRQSIDLGGESQKVESGINQFAANQTANRLILTVGKFSAGDIFDTNRYAHDARSDFLNWSFIDSVTFDYAADAWGFTYGAAAEWYHGPWTFRAGVFDMSVVPNSPMLDPRFGQFQSIVEIERRYELWGQPGKIAFTGFLTRARMGRYDDAVRMAQLAGGTPDPFAVRRYTSRTGLSFNMEQKVSADLGVFARAGIASRDVAPYEFADVDRSIAAGAVLSGQRWGRPNDTVGMAGALNGASGAHLAYLNAGGLGITVGDGRLPHPGTEQIVEIYYSLSLLSWHVTLDYQFIVNPGYNRDRGPVSVIGTRLRTQF